MSVSEAFVPGMTVPRYYWCSYQPEINMNRNNAYIYVLYQQARRDVPVENVH
jgi:hypothetical protein